MIYLDTHVVVRLYAGDVEELGAAARKSIEENDLLISAAVLLELEFLHEIGRLQPGAANVAATLAEAIGLRVCDLPFRTVVEHALKESWGRDPFDRLIVANAKARRAPLVTKDERVRRHFAATIW